MFFWRRNKKVSPDSAARMLMKIAWDSVLSGDEILFVKQSGVDEGVFRVERVSISFAAVWIAYRDWLSRPEYIQVFDGRSCDEAMAEISRRECKRISGRPDELYGHVMARLEQYMSAHLDDVKEASEGAISFNVPRLFACSLVDGSAPVPFEVMPMAGELFFRKYKMASRKLDALRAY